MTGGQKMFDQTFDTTIAVITDYNLGQNICRLFHFLAQFVFTTSETEVDYYHQKVNLRVASRVAERLRKFQENP